MAIRQTICESLGGFLCTKSEISSQTQENISKWRSVAERKHISRDLTDQFSLIFPDSYMAMRRIFCVSLGEFSCAKSEISPQTQENMISKWRSVAERKHISPDLTDRFSLNFPDSSMAIRQTICESLGGFLCARSEISPQTQENISKWRYVTERKQSSSTSSSSSSVLQLILLLLSPPSPPHPPQSSSSSVLLNLLLSSPLPQSSSSSFFSVRLLLLLLNSPRLPQYPSSSSSSFSSTSSSVLLFPVLLNLLLLFSPPTHPPLPQSSSVLNLLLLLLLSSPLP